VGERIDEEKPMRQIRALAIGVALTALAAGLSSSSAFAQSDAQPTLDKQIEEGEAIFQVYCSPCHGRDARGEGPVAADLKTTPPSLREIAKRRGGAFDESQVAAYIDGRNMPRAHGTPEMPVWGSLFRYVAEVSDTLASDEQAIEHKAQERIAMLVKYLATLQEK
jgi:mono/diheme cytochrome c family protein